MKLSSVSLGGLFFYSSGEGLANRDLRALSAVQRQQYFPHFAQSTQKTWVRISPHLQDSLNVSGHFERGSEDWGDFRAARRLHGGFMELKFSLTANVSSLSSTAVHAFLIDLSGSA